MINQFMNQRYCNKKNNYLTQFANLIKIGFLQLILRKHPNYTITITWYLLTLFSLV